MPYSEPLAERIRAHLGALPIVSERKMFGGLAFMVKGHMCCGILGERLMLRIGEEAAEYAMERPHVSPMDFTGRPMKGMIFVEPAGTRRDDDLKRWLDKALAHVETLPKRTGS